jgi:ATP-dependent DNA helicase RecG
MISGEKIKSWLAEGESERIEFKLSFGQDTIETLVAFANHKGGNVIIGVSDDAEVLGISLSKESTNHWINEVKSKTAPQLVPDAEIYEFDGKKIVRLVIAEYPVKPVSFRGRYYKRKANANHLLSTTEVVNAHLQSVNSSWDFYIRPSKKITDISMDKVIWQIERINHGNRFR